MSTTTIDLPTRRAHSVPAHPAVRAHRRQVAAWALAHGHVVGRDALAAIVGSRSDPFGSTSFRWTSHAVGLVLWSGAASWCNRNGAAPPSDMAATLSTYLRYLSAHRLLGEGSDSPGALKRAVTEHRLPEGTSRSRHPAARARRAPVLPLGTG